MPILVRGCAHPRGMPDDWYKGIKYLKEKEMLEKVLNLPGTVTLDEHDDGSIGRVVGTMFDAHGQIFVDVEISEDTPDYEEIKRKLLSGEYGGLSLGRKHQIDINTGELVKTNIMEVSICEKGALPGTYIEAVTVASDVKQGLGTGVFGCPPVVDLVDVTVTSEGRTVTTEGRKETGIL